MGDASKVYRALTSIPWAITEDYLRLMVEVAQRKEVDIAAVEERLGRKLDNTRTVTERGGVAIIPVTGPIFRYANLFSEISGGTSVQVLARDFRAALDNPDVRAILLNIDSPGGDANGINEFASMVYAARPTKPIHAYIGGMGCSAAYWIASAASEIICDATALIGSIGVIASMPAEDDPSEVVFISSQSPRKRESPTTEAGRASIQATIDAMADVFVGRVAEYRGVDTDTVLTSFGQGGIFVGQGAVAAGLVDRLGSFEQTLAGMSRGRAEPASPALRAGASPGVAAVVGATPASLVATADVLTRLAAVPFNTLSGFKASLAGKPAAIPTPTTKETRTMSDPTVEEARVAPPVAAPPPDAPVMSEAERAAFFASERSRYQAELDAIKTEARLEVQREIAKDRREQKLMAWAQDVASASLDRPYAIPIEPKELGTFAIALDAFSPKLAEQFQTFTMRILDAGLIDFREIGSQGGSEEPDHLVIERYNAAVAAKVATGMKKSDALAAVQIEQPALQTAYNAARQGGR